MSMSTHIAGIRPPDEKFRKMLAVHDACRVAGVDLPREVADFFDGEVEPDPSGVVVNLLYPNRSAAVSPWGDGATSEGFEVDLSKLDPTIRVLRFYNSW